MKYRIKNVISLRSLIHEFKPQIVHAHSRAASWVCWFATIAGPALISTVHGRQHWYTRFKWNDVYGNRIIAICGYLHDHLVKDFRISPKRIDLIRNLIETDEYRKPKNIQSSGKIRLGLFGRMSGPKGKIWGMLLRDVIPKLMDEFPNLEILIGGGTLDLLESRDRDTIESFLRTHPERSRFFGKSPHLANEISEIDFIICAGRIAIEALFAGKKVFGFGEYQPTGWLTRSSLPLALASNFGDVGPDRAENRWWRKDLLKEQLRTAFKGGIEFDLDENDLNRNFGADETYHQIKSSYIQAILSKKYRFGIPSLMFHKVVSGDFFSKHKTYIEIKNFTRILNLFKIFRKQTITFQDLIEACEGRRSFPKRPILLTFDDGYKDTLTLAAPALKEAGMKAVIYLLADSTVRTNRWDTEEDTTEISVPLLSPEERQTIKESGVFEIGSHGLSHRSLTVLPSRDREREIAESKRLLENEFSIPILSYAYAYGNYSGFDAESVSRFGYRFGVGTDTHYGIEENTFRIFRANVFPDDGFFSVLKKSSPLYRFYFSAKRKFRSRSDRPIT